jgi:L-alanine-DL-glutamate epimerase-like enolase superfamily enzyme
MKTATNSFAVATGLLIEIVSDEELRGYGYADLFPRSGETISTAQAIIDEIIFPGIKDKDPRELKILLEWMNKQVVGHSRAEAAVEMAILDLRGKAAQLPVYEFLGGALRKSVTVMRMVGLKVGGILQAKRVADLCEAAGIQCIVSNVGGSLLNDAAAIQVIAASASTDLPCEVGEFQRVTGDPACGLEVRNGEICIPAEPGLGVEVAFPQ